MNPNDVLKTFALQALGGTPIASLVTNELFPGGGMGGKGPLPMGDNDIRGYARRRAREEFGRGHWPELNRLVTHESSWNPQADNPTSSAYGLFQFLDSTRKNYGIGLNATPWQQVDAGLDYIKDRYRNPSKAWDFWTQHRWY